MEAHKGQRWKRWGQIGKDRDRTIVNKTLLRLPQGFLNFRRSEDAARQTGRNGAILQFPSGDDDGDSVLVDGRFRELFQAVMICDQVDAGARCTKIGPLDGLEDQL